MPNLNDVHLIGYVTREIPLRYTKSGSPVTDISLAINERKLDKNGDISEETTFLDCVLWSKLALFAHHSIKKGDCVLVCGKLKTEKWNKDGQQRSKLKVVAHRIQRLIKQDISEEVGSDDNIPEM